MHGDGICFCCRIYIKTQRDPLIAWQWGTISQRDFNGLIVANPIAEGAVGKARKPHYVSSGSAKLKLIVSDIMIQPIEHEFSLECDLAANRSSDSLYDRALSIWVRIYEVIIHHLQRFTA
ncbi:hypothetical protein D3C73_815500 [compost metagenome]